MAEEVQAAIPAPERMKGPDHKLESGHPAHFNQGQGKGLFTRAYEAFKGAITPAPPPVETPKVEPPPTAASGRKGMLEGKPGQSPWGIFE